MPPSVDRRSRAGRDPAPTPPPLNDRRRVALVTAIAAAVEADDVRSDIDPELAAVVVAGAVVYRRLMTSRHEVEPLIDTVLGW